ncbi:MAG: glutathione S-transferase family protein [Psychrobacter sp.]|nr:glutathione S-transferase family protein [Psychrobacter sp.]
MLTLYGNKNSGNSYKTKLTCELLGIDYHWVEIDILAKENREPEYLAINPLGQVPALKIEPDNNDAATILVESNAIIRYLADGSRLIPTDRLGYAQMWQWLLYEQTEVRANIGPVRFIKKFQNMPHDRLDEYKTKFAKSKTVLQHLNEQLDGQNFILGDTVSLADIALYAYTHVAEDGGLDLAPFENLRAWFGRIEGLDGFMAM